MSKIFFFAEDPGAASYLAPIANALSTRVDVKFYANGFARNLLADRKVNFIDCSASHEQAINEFINWKPDLLFVGTAENKKTLGLELIRIANKNGIKSIGAVDAMMNAPFRFSGATNNPTEFAPDFTIVPDEATKIEFLDLGFKNVFALGHPNFDLIFSQSEVIQSRSRAERREEYFPGAGEKPVIVFLAEGSARLLSYESLPWERYSLRPKYFFQAKKIQGRTELTLAAMLEALPNPEMVYKVLRQHPKDTDEDYIDFRSQMDGFSKGGSAWPLLLSADLVVGATTVLLMEAAILGVPTLSIVPQLNEGNWLASVRQGITPCISKMEELDTYLKKIKKLNTDPRPNENLAPRNVTQAVVKFADQLLGEQL